MAFKPVGIDENSLFPTRVMTALRNIFLATADADERAQDAVAAAFAAGTQTGITFTHDDANNKFSLAVTASGGASTPLAIVNVKDYNAKGDNSTNDATAIQNAITAVANRTASYGSGIVYFPPGIYLSGSTFTVPKNIKLIGEGAGASILQYTGSTSSTGVFLTFGASGTINTNGGIERMQVDANGKLGWCLLMYGPQEGSVLSLSLIRGGTTGGLDCRSSGIEGGNNKFLINSCWIWTNNTGIYGAKFDDANGPFAIRDTTLVRTGGGTAPAGSAGLYFNGGLSILDNVNCEQWESHTNQDAWTRSSGRLLSSYGCTYGITVRATSGADPDISYQFETVTFDSATYYVNDLQTNTQIASISAYRRHGPSPQNVKTVSGNYTAQFDDQRLVVLMSAAGTFTIPQVDNNGKPWRKGVKLQVMNTSTGTVTIAAGSGVTLRSASGLRLTAQYATVTLTMFDWDNWVVSAGQTVT